MCLDDQMLSSYLDGELEEPWKSQVEAHLDWCKACQVRLENLKNLENKVKDASLSQSEIETRKERVMALLDKNVLNKTSHTWWGKLKDFVKSHVFVPIGATAAATFCVCLILFTPSVKGDTIPYIQGPFMNINDITPVRASDNYTTEKSLSSYSLEDILKYLDSMGYDVQLRLKNIIPILNEQELDSMTEEAEDTSH